MRLFRTLFSFKPQIYRIVFIGAAVFLFIILIYNLDLLIEHVKNNPLLGIPYFFLQLILHIITKYAFIVIGLVVLLFFLSTKFTKSRPLAMIYFILPLPFLSIVLGEEEFLPFNLIVSGIFFLLGIGIWKNKTWVHIAALVLNAVFLAGAAFLFSSLVNTSCEGLGCIGVGIIWILSLYIVVFTFLTSPFIWYNIRAKDSVGVNKKIAGEALGVGIIIVAIVVGVFGQSYFAYSNKVEEHRSIHQPRWDRERFEREQAIQEAIDSGKIIYPSYIPWGWEKESEYIDKIQYVKYGISRQVLQVKQVSRDSFEAKTNEGMWADDARWKEQDQISINGVSARYVTWSTAACTISDEIRELWWYDQNTFRSLYCSCPCTLSKSELLRIAESMKSSK